MSNFVERQLCILFPKIRKLPCLDFILKALNQVRTRGSDCILFSCVYKRVHLFSPFFHRNKVSFFNICSAIFVLSKCRLYVTFLAIWIIMSENKLTLVIFYQWEWLYRYKVLLSNAFHFVEWALFKNKGSV